MGRVAIIALSLAFAGLVLWTQAGPIALDREILLAFQRDGVPAGPRWLVEAARNITALGSYTLLGIVIAGVAGYLFLIRDRATAWFVLLSAASGAVLNTLLKIGFDRARPDFVTPAVEVFTASFPSGHAALSAVVYLTLGALLANIHRSLAFRFYFIGLGIVLALIVGLSRIYLGVHYPTDVLAGWCFGAAWALICWRVMRRLQRRGEVSPAANP